MKLILDNRCTLIKPTKKLVNGVLEVSSTFEQYRLILKKFVGDKSIRKVIVVKKKLVNIVV